MIKFVACNVLSIVGEQIFVDDSLKAIYDPNAPLVVHDLRENNIMGNGHCIFAVPGAADHPLARLVRSCAQGIPTGGMPVVQGSVMTTEEKFTHSGELPINWQLKLCQVLAAITASGGSAFPANWREHGVSDDERDKILDSFNKFERRKEIIPP